MKLSHFVKGRNNNFNLIRLIAAWAVLVSHSFALVAGKDGDPLVPFLGMNLGAIAVDVFFITSGFLVTGSLIVRQSTLQFVWARILRIYPALVVAVLFMVCGLGLFFTTEPAASFLASRQTLDFSFRNATLLSGIRFHLPGVFGSVPYDHVVNGSLWTLVYELRMYVILAVMWPALYVFGKFRTRALSFFVVMFAASSLLVRFANHYYFHSAKHVDLIRLFYMFFLGAAYFFLKEHISLSRSAFWLALGALVVSGLNQQIFFAVYNIVLAYILFWIAYIPAGGIRNFNRLGDYSYGTYIYAFPIQQSVLALVPGVSVMLLILLSSVPTLFLAVLSWHLIEKRALSLKGSPAKGPRHGIEMQLTTQPTPAN